MNTIKISLIVACLIFSFSKLAHAKKRATASSCAGDNVEAALLSLHNENFWFRDSGEPMSRAFLKSTIKVRDIRNGYLKIMHDDFVSTFDVSLFRSNAGNILLISSTGTSSDGLHALRCVGSNWASAKEIEKQLEVDAVDLHKKFGYLGVKLSSGEVLSEENLRNYAGNAVRHTLPRRGKLILLTSSYDDTVVFGKALGQFDFDGTSFKYYRGQ